MDAIKLLKEDHRKVAELLEKAEKTTERAAKKREELFKKIKDELTIHTKIEEVHFYPALKEFKATRDLIFESFEEHHLVDVVLEEMSKLDFQDEQWTAKMAVLKELVRHHVNEEEKDLFPKVKKLLDTEDLKALGVKMMAMKEEMQKNV